MQLVMCRAADALLHAGEYAPVRMQFNPHPKPLPIKREGLPERCMAPLPSLWGKGRGDGGGSVSYTSTLNNSAALVVSKLTRHSRTVTTRWYASAQGKNSTLACTCRR